MNTLNQSISSRRIWTLSKLRASWDGHSLLVYFMLFRREFPMKVGMKVAFVVARVLCFFLSGINIWIRHFKAQMQFVWEYSCILSCWLNVLKGSDHSNFSNLPCIKCDFLTDLRNKTLTCYTFSVTPIIPESKNLKIAMKKLMKKKT